MVSTSRERVPEGGISAPRILLVTHYYAGHGGGVEIVAGELARRLSGSLDLEWIAAGTPSEAGPATGDATVVRAHSLRAWNGLERRFGLPMPLPSPAGAVAVWRAARRADGVWVHDLIYPANALAALAAVSARKPLVVTVHVGAIPYRSRAQRWAMAGLVAATNRLLLSKASAVVFVSERVRSEFLERWRFRDHGVVPNGVDLEVFEPADPEARRAIRASLDADTGARMVLFVGRFVERKGLPLLRDLAARMPSVTWWFAGNGPIRPDTWKLPNVRVERNRGGQSLAELYQAADLLALPSLGEGFPLVVGEALASGLPVLVDPSTVAGYPRASEVIESEPVSGPDALDRWQRHIEAMLDTASKPDAARAAARRAFAVTNWGWNDARDRYLALWGELLEAAARKRGS